MFGQNAINFWMMFAIFGLIILFLFVAISKLAIDRLVYNISAPILDRQAELINRVPEILARQDLIIKNSNIHDGKLDVLWEAMPLAFFITDESILPVAVNQAYIRLWGFENAEDAKTGAWLDYLTPDSRQLAEIRFDYVSQHYYQFAYEMELLDGRLFKVIGYPLFADPVGRKGFVGYSGVVMDISDRGASEV